MVVVAGLVGSGGGGLTPLVFAAREGHVDTARALLDAGAPVNQTTEYGWTPLLTAVNNRHLKLAAMLGYGVWQSRYGLDPGVLGRTIRLISNGS
jgi:hypothetical protein